MVKRQSRSFFSAKLFFFFKHLVMKAISMNTSLSRFLTHVLSASTVFLSELDPVEPECVGASDDRP